MVLLMLSTWGISLWWCSQVAYPELQKRKMERARHRQWRHEAVRAMQRHVKPMGSMLTKEGV